MIRRLSLVLVSAAGLILAAAPSEAQKQEKVEKTDEQIAQESMKKLITAYELAEEGFKKNAPEYLITAAGMLRQLPTLKMKKIDEKAEVSGSGKGDEDKEVKPPTLREQADEWFKEASDMGAAAGVNVDKLVKLAKDREPGTRAVVGGPRVVAMLIGSGQTHTYNLTIFTHGHTHFAFQADRPMRVNVVHRGGPNSVWLDQVAVYGGAQWFPLGRNPGFYSKHKTAGITIRIMNNTNRAGRYQMMIE